jgi:hypothetical protein
MLPDAYKRKNPGLAVKDHWLLLGCLVHSHWGIKAASENSSLDWGRVIGYPNTGFL